ncbi:hypothetical protein BDR26DRAFT_854260 [Obelidium mucronatum]|nr:hypothetical protein BDR26DRAFT_854260 [Obelidium mucronatum]
MITEAQKNSTMKITEPKTPFIHYNMSTDEITGHSGEIPPMQLNSALEYVQIQQSTSSSSGSSFMLTSDTESIHSNTSNGKASDGNHHEHHHAFIAKGEWDDDNEDGKGGHKDMTPEEYEKHLKFEKLRSQHYNMKEKLAEARRKMEAEDAEEEESPASMQNDQENELEVEDYQEDEESDS